MQLPRQLPRRRLAGAAGLQAQPARESRGRAWRGCRGSEDWSQSGHERRGGRAGAGLTCGMQESSRSQLAAAAWGSRSSVSLLRTHHREKHAR